MFGILITLAVGISASAERDGCTLGDFICQMFTGYSSAICDHPNGVCSSPEGPSLTPCACENWSIGTLPSVSPPTTIAPTTPIAPSSTTADVTVAEATFQEVITGQATQAITPTTTEEAVFATTAEEAVSGTTTTEEAVSGTTTTEEAVSGSTTEEAVSGTTTKEAVSGTTTTEEAVSGTTTTEEPVSGTTTEEAVSGTTTTEEAVSGTTTVEFVETTEAVVGTTEAANSAETTTTIPAAEGDSVDDEGDMPYCDNYCIGLNSGKSYCKSWLSVPVCHGGDQSCDTSVCIPDDTHSVESSTCDTYCVKQNPDLAEDEVSYCKWWLGTPTCFSGDQPCPPSVCGAGTPDY
ncbi:mucin-3A, putative [Perkinsus marinus ATCC 50983]|uniref:Mucin-3A, putative n=1 Tax=Perkinsus marinus (strain ATCC 50983 / TXsc) TaxID=423536 RepID=C5LEN8_PERM5|nr:mucin-3A, putative [Perkinsus marinus ATCC 50983]EER04856.1 mucin-3A, putative [Perkinsus marinus ATCC 50983]|eukprot:XP_002773040.1 mucin-3A, putative [Perkinsus marinus ATCC 50983]